MKHILITGGTGFLGSNLCLRLVREGNKVICVDNNYTGSLDNVRDLIGNDSFKFIEHDVINPFSIEEPIDQIYHLACPASPPAYQGKHSIKTTKTCVFGAVNVLELAKEKNAIALLVSTSEIYGNPLVHPQSESYCGNVNPIGIRSCYDEGKRCAESLFFDYYRHENVSVKVVRIFNTYGPLMNPEDGRVVSNLICQAMRGEDLTIYGKGDQTRSFCYVDDTIEALIRMMNSDKNFIGPVNIGNPNEITMKDLSGKVLSKIKSSSSLRYQDLPQDDPVKRCPDISLAKEKLSWRPSVSLDEGLDKTIKYFKEKLKR